MREPAPLTRANVEFMIQRRALSVDLELVGGHLLAAYPVRLLGQLVSE
jgi:hypothetical protein